MDPYQIVVRPVITEKSTMLGEQGQYVFEVAERANEIEIKQAVEQIFSVTVRQVRVLRVTGKLRRVGRHAGVTRSWKKAVVSLAPGQRIELYEGV